jgi:hypothetical protein
VKVGLRMSGGKVHGFGVLRCADRVTHITVGVKLYRDRVLIATDTNRGSGTNLRAEASRTCVNANVGFFRAWSEAQYQFNGTHVNTGWLPFPAPPNYVSLACGV